MTQDIILATVSLLKADLPVAALASTRVFGGELPAEQAGKMPRTAIVVKRATGPGGLGAYIELELAPVNIWCYGAQVQSADKLYRTIRTALKQMRRQVREGFLLHSYEESGSGENLRDTNARWPFTLSTWVLLASEVVTP